MSSELEKTTKTFDRGTLLRRGAAAGGTFALAGWLPTLASARRESTTLNLVAYSTPKPVMAALIAAFQATPAGQGVSFTQSYGPSTSQAQAVAAGLPCDIIFPSWPGDVQILVDAGLVNKNWNEQSYKGVVANTVVAFAVRHYNPKKIKGWNDLVKPGVQVITPGPVQLRLGEVEHPRGLLGPAPPRQDRRAGARLRPAALQERGRPADLGLGRDRRLPLG